MSGTMNFGTDRRVAGGDGFRAFRVMATGSGQIWIHYRVRRVHHALAMMPARGSLSPKPFREKYIPGQTRLGFRVRIQGLDITTCLSSAMETDILL